MAVAARVADRFPIRMRQARTDRPWRSGTLSGAVLVARRAPVKCSSGVPSQTAVAGDLKVDGSPPHHGCRPVFEGSNECGDAGQ